MPVARIPDNQVKAQTPDNKIYRHEGIAKERYTKVCDPGNPKHGSMVKEKVPSLPWRRMVDADGNLLAVVFQTCGDPNPVDGGQGAVDAQYYRNGLTAELLGSGHFFADECPVAAGVMVADDPCEGSYDADNFCKHTIHAIKTRREDGRRRNHEARIQSVNEMRRARDAEAIAAATVKGIQAAQTQAPQAPQVDASKLAALEAQVAELVAALSKRKGKDE